MATPRTGAVKNNIDDFQVADHAVADASGEDDVVVETVGTPIAVTPSYRGSNLAKHHSGVISINKRDAKKLTSDVDV